MTYNFHEYIDRKNTASMKWEMTKTVFGTDDVLPMWVADMDFKPPKEVVDAFNKRIDHGIFGYTIVPSSATEAVQSWLKKRHGWEVDEKAFLYNSGVVPSIAIAVHAFTEQGDKIMLQSPVYAPFFNMIKMNGREVVNSPLTIKDGRFEIDFADFEEKLKEGVKLFLLCNPHNPGGRVWTEEELRKIGDLCAKYNCYIFSDEIHSDLILRGNKHIPIASLDQKYADITLTAVAPTKTFNLAGIKASSVVIENEKLRNQFRRTQARLSMHELNTFGIVGLEAAYRHGEQWLNDLLTYIEENIDIVVKFIEEHLPDIKPMIPDSTYLIWIDCRGTGLTDEEIRKALIEKGKLGLEPGTKYGPGGEGFVRMNVACSRDVLMDGLNRFKKAFS